MFSRPLHLLTHALPILVAGSLCAAASAQVLYELAPLRGMNSPFGRTFAADVSDDGVVLGGTAPQNSGPFHVVRTRPAVWIGGEMMMLQRIVPSYGLNNVPNDINAAGTIVGASGFAFGDPNLATDTLAVMWDSDGLSVIGALPGDGNSAALAINDTGVVVGTSGPNFPYFSGFEHAFRWTNGVMTELPGLPGSFDAHAFDINDAGTIVGASGDFFGRMGVRSAAVYWSGGVVHELPLPPGAVDGDARVINDSGVIAGRAGMLQFSVFDPTLVPVRWQNGVPESLPLLPGDNFGEVFDINAVGTIVGSSGFIDGFIRRIAMVVWIDGVVHDLRAVTRVPVGWQFDRGPLGINDVGQIAGSGILGDRGMAFLATPVAQPAN